MTTVSSKWKVWLELREISVWGVWGLAIYLIPLAILAVIGVQSLLLDWGKQILWMIGMPQEKSRIYLLLVAQTWFIHMLVGAIFCYPLAFAYRRIAVCVAMLCALPWLYFSVPGLFDFDRKWQGLVMSYYDVFAAVGILVGGTHLARMHLLVRDQQTAKLPSHGDELK